MGKKCITVPPGQWEFWLKSLTLELPLACRYDVLQRLPSSANGARIPESMLGLMPCISPEECVACESTRGRDWTSYVDATRLGNSTPAKLLLLWSVPACCASRASCTCSLGLQ